ncbi:glutamate racemase [Deferribacteraceae bacterium V6Fe1]|nr:glutamate racemase [Deferribacteraceae bacterium V6Fe1]
MAIGVFDSGIGGLTVFKTIIKNFKDTDLYYLGDTARVPYGNKSKETIRRYSLECSNFLINNYQIDCLVIACNTASSYALDFLKSKLNIPVIGVVEPGAQLASQLTKNKKVGIIGTVGTIKSNSYYNAIKKICSDIEIYQNPSPLLVPLVEEGRIDHEITKLAVKEYISPLVEKGIDTLVLGCTHYPVLKNVIVEIYPNLKLVDSSEAIIPDIVSCLSADKREGGKKLILTTDETEAFNALKDRLVGGIKLQKIDLKEII